MTVHPSTPASAISWLHHFQLLQGPPDDPEVQAQLPLFVNVFPVLTTSTCPPFHEQLSSVLEPSTALIVFTNTHQIALLHHLHYDGGPWGTKRLWALRGVTHFSSGTNTPAVLVSSPTADSPIFRRSVLPAAVPPLITLLACVDEDGVRAATSSNTGDPAPIMMYLTSAISLPPFMTTALALAASDDPATLCLAACQAILDFDALATDSSPTASTHLAFIPQFLWAAAVHPRLFPCVLLDNSALPRVHNWATSVTASALSHPTAPPTVANSTVENPENHLSMVLQHLVDKIAPPGAATKSSPETEIWDKLMPDIQQMIINASELVPPVLDEEGLTLPPQLRTYPFPTLAALLDSSAGDAIHRLSTLCSRDSLSLRPIANLATSLRSCHLLWTSLDQTGPFSLFALAPTTLLMPDMPDSLPMSLQARDGTGLSDSTVAKASTLWSAIPTHPSHLADYFRNWAGIFKHILGYDAPLTAGGRRWYEHFQLHHTTYALLFRRDPDFGTQLLANLDADIQEFLRDASAMSSGSFPRHHHQIFARWEAYRSDIASRQNPMRAHAVVLTDNVARLAHHQWPHLFPGPPSKAPLPPPQQSQSLGLPPPAKRAKQEYRPRHPKPDRNESINPDLAAIMDNTQHLSILSRAVMKDGRSTLPPPLPSNTCLKFHCRGFCPQPCNRAHGVLTPAQATGLLNWARSTLKL